MQNGGQSMSQNFILPLSDCELAINGMHISPKFPLLFFVWNFRGSRKQYQVQDLFLTAILHNFFKT